ncbi:MAG: hypothetical protein AABY36_00905 [Campylobacterota bacterium]|jgi:predicted DNA-binding protein
MATNTIKSANEMLKLYTENKTIKDKKSFTLSLPLDIINKIDYMSLVTGKSKNSIVLEALKAFGIEDIKIPDNSTQENN